MRPQSWAQAFNDLPIAAKLNVGFGVLVVLMLVGVGLIFAAGRRATVNIDMTRDVRAPAALASAQAQASLLDMQANVRGYLALGDLRYIDDYNKAKEVFEENLALLNTLSTDWTEADDIQRLNDLKVIFDAWSPIPEQLFELHDDPIANQQALRIESTNFRPSSALVLQQIDELIRLQESRRSSPQQSDLLFSMNDMRISHQAMATNLRAYAISGDVGFKVGYGENLDVNRSAFQQLVEARDLMTVEQQENLDMLQAERSELLTLPQQVFSAIEGERTVEDLYLFRTEAEPLAETMVLMLGQMTTAQQAYLQADLDRSKVGLTRVQFQILLGGLLALALGIGMALFFRRTIAHPVKRLEQTAGHIGAGDLDAQAQVTSADEIGSLAQAFNAMTGRLRQTIGSLEEASQAKSEFLANMSHELRTPLNAILGYAQILQRSSTLESAQRKQVEIIYESGSHLLLLINDVLDLSKIEASKLELYPSDFPLPQFLDGIIEIFRMRADQAGGPDFQVEFLTPLPSLVHADETRLRQVLMNLLSNALKFTQDGVVVLRVAATETHMSTSGGVALARLHFQVEDTGIGMTEEELAQIFLPFEQVGDPNLRAKGTGLGLSITHSLVDEMQGRLEVQSTLGQGTRFEVALTFPVVWATTETPTVSTFVVGGYEGRRRTVLIVDDEPYNRKLLTELLRPLGFQVAEAADGASALNLTKNQLPDIVLLDLVLPEMNGYEVAWALRDRYDPTHEQMTIIAVSASAFEQQMLESERAGCDAFLSKPVEIDRLLALLQDYANLTWVANDGSQETCEEPSTEQIQPKLPQTQIPLPAEELAILIDLSKKGELPRLMKVAEKMATRDSRYAPFAGRLRPLVEDFDEEGMQTLLDEMLAVQSTVPDNTCTDLE